jgi:nitrogen fixation NifU-like protein
LPKPDSTGEGYNPVCGDEVTIQVSFKNGKVEKAMFMGRGCSISQASSSMLTELIAGKNLQEVQKLIEKLKAMMTKGEPPTPEMGDLEALEGVRKFPVRVKCATLAWNVLEDIIKNANR